MVAVATDAEGFRTLSGLAGAVGFHAAFALAGVHLVARAKTRAA
jgi:hypothetical protein